MASLKSNTGAASSVSLAHLAHVITRKPFIHAGSSVSLAQMLRRILHSHKFGSGKQYIPFLFILSNVNEINVFSGGLVVSCKVE